MTLREFLFVNRIKSIDFAALCGLSNSYVSQIKEEKVVPSKVVQLAVEFVTGGEVRYKKDWGKK